ncbi:MAG: hypothetical protein K2H82_04925 [Oscillospiraceae bacterium]|nr:hypothetical protein [Oscillospiraceae bacterium]
MRKKYIRNRKQIPDVPVKNPAGGIEPPSLPWRGSVLSLNDAEMPGGKIRIFCLEDRRFLLSYQQFQYNTFF